MKYKTRIIETDSGYIGHANLNEEVVYTTNIHPDPIMVTRELSVFLSSKAQQNSSPVVPNNAVKNVNQTPGPSVFVPVKSKMINSQSAKDTSLVETVKTPTPVSNFPQQKCCGRR